MKSIVRAGAFFLFGLLFINAVSAQEFSGNFGIGIFAGPQKLVGGNTDKSMIGPWGGVTLFFGLSDRVVLSFSAGDGWTHYADAQDPFAKTSAAHWQYFRTWLWPADVNFSLYLKNNGRFRPYLQLGAGILVWQLNYERWGSDLFSPSGFNKTGTQYNAKGNAGLGVTIALSQHLLLDLSGRYHYLYDQNRDNIGDGYDWVKVNNDNYGDVVSKRPGDVNNGILEFRIGLNLLFGGPKDSDHDGIIDRLDKAPNEPEDFDGFQDEDGVPDPDNDNDGIPDVKDKCPNEPEDIDGFMDTDGCPDPDNDHDGILDKDDKCPNQPEDFDGFQDADGCPDPDNDGDGIPDTKDLCPNKAETVNGYQDEDGCPDEAPKKEPSPMKKGVNLIFPGVTFLTGSAKLTAQAKLTLDNVYQMLYDHSEVVIEIRGYTDNTGSAAINQKLSAKRAQSVKEYLTNKGISANKIVAYGYGEENPLADNSTKEGRAKNRRIEFVRIK